MANAYKLVSFATNMQKYGYKQLAKFYDSLYGDKDYAAEVSFLERLFDGHRVTKVLDVGCGTGTHMNLLQKDGFRCTGIDINQEMLDIARKKVKGGLVCADMTDFHLNEKYDAIICMFAGFNHLLSTDDARKAIRCFQENLNQEGIVLLDLHNPQRNGRKRNIVDGIERIMEWNYNPNSRLERTDVVFKTKGQTFRDSLTMRIYSPDEIKQLLIQEGFTQVQAYDGYGFNPGSQKSKNLEILAKR